MKNVGKRLLIVILVVCLGSMAGCGKNTDNKNTNENTNENTNKNVDVNTIAEGLLRDVSFKDDLAVIDNEIAITKVYYLEKDKIDSAVFYMNTNATAEEIAVIKVTDDEYVEAVKAAFENRVKAQKDACKDYLPDEMPKLESAVIYTAGNCVVLCISNDNDAAKDKIAEYFK